MVAQAQNRFSQRHPTASAWWLGTLTLVVMGLSGVERSSAEEPRERYRRAVAWRESTANTVLNLQLDVQWLPDGQQAWFRRNLPGKKHEFRRVNCQRGTNELAFDHERLAAALRQAGVEGADSKRLQVELLSLLADGSSCEVRSSGRRWKCDLTSYELSEVQADAAAIGGNLEPLANVPRTSRPNGPETSIDFLNRTAAEVELLWLDQDGQLQSYGKVASGKSRQQHTYAGHVWLVHNVDGRAIAAFEATNKSASAMIDNRRPRRRGPTDEPRQNRPRRESQISPDGKWEALVRDHNVWVKEVATGQERQLSSDGKAEDSYESRWYWSPDSTRLVAIQTQPGDERKVRIIESTPKGQLQPVLHEFEYLKPGDRLPRSRPRLFHVVEGRAVPVSDELFGQPWSADNLRWDDNSKRITFVYNQRGHQVLRILAVDAESGAVRPIVDERSETFIDYAHKQFSHFVPGTDELVWMSERDGWNHLYLYDAQTGAVKNPITQGEWVVRRIEHIDDDARQIWFFAGGIRPEQDPYYLHLARVNFDGTGLTVLTAGDGNHSVSFSPDRSWFVDSWSRVDLPTVHELRRADNGELVCELARADVTALVEKGWRAPQPFVAKGRDGQTDIYGVIWRPSKFDPARKYPVVEQIYAGPQGAFVPKSFRLPGLHEEMAELGFVVVQIDGMGTSYRSKKFHDVCWKNLADAGFPDRIAWLRAAAAAEPAIDLNRVGIFGGSAGGQNALRALLGHGDFYKVAVADCGCHDNRMDKVWWNELWMGWPIGPHYAEQANATQAHKLTGKLLLVVGELDRNVDPASTMQVAAALVKADRDFDLLVIPGAGHGAAETPYGRRRRAEFLVRQLEDVQTLR